MILAAGGYTHGARAVEAVTDHYMLHFHKCANHLGPQPYLLEYEKEIEDIRANIDCQVPAGGSDGSERSDAPDPWRPPSIDSFKAALHKCRDSSPGTDGWTANELELLPQKALERLIEFFCVCERAARWPQICYEWRQVNIPKGAGTASVDQLRPIGIGQVLIRSWHRYRTRQIMRHVEPAVPLHVAGGVPGRTIEQITERLLTSLEAAESGFGPPHPRT